MGPRANPSTVTRPCFAEDAAEPRDLRSLQGPPPAEQAEDPAALRQPSDSEHPRPHRQALGLRGVLASICPSARTSFDAVDVGHDKCGHVSRSKPGSMIRTTTLHEDGFHLGFRLLCAWNARSTGMTVGAVKWFNAEKGFGFITPDGGGEDLFVHHSAIQMQGYRDLAEGQRVEFEITQGQKGMQASNVHPI